MAPRLAPAMGKDRRKEAFVEYQATSDPTRREELETELVLGHQQFCWREARRYRLLADMEELFAEAQAAFVIGVVRRYGRGVDAELRPDTDAWLHFAELVLKRELRAYVRRSGTFLAVPRTSGTLGGKAKAAPAVGGSEGTAAAVLASDLLPTSTPDPYEESERASEAEALNRAVATLPERTATVVRMRFGLAGMAPHELAEIGVVIGVSKQRVALILEQALVTLRQAFAPTKAAA